MWTFLVNIKVLLFFFLHPTQGCDPILDEPDSHTFRDRNRLTIHRVETEDSGTYTCTLTFTLDGITGSVSETIDAAVSGQFRWT